MKRTFTLILALTIIVGFQANAGTPIINGVYDANEGWGAPVGTGDGIAGWSDANAKTLYITHDDTYVYFAAECTAQSWQQYIIILNTKPGGNNTDTWGRTITYAQTESPDFLFRGDITGSNYAEFHSWNGSSWDGLGINVNAGGAEVKGIFDGSNNGFVELRVPKSLIGSDLFDVEFIIGGNSSGEQSGHGCFDAIPNDDNCTGWNAPDNVSIVTNYITNISLPLKFVSFIGNTQNNTTNLAWNTANEDNVDGFIIEQSIDGNNWLNKGSIAAYNTSAGTYYFNVANDVSAPLTFYRIKMINKDGSFNYSKIVSIKINVRAGFQLIGNPVKNTVKLAITMKEKAVITGRLMSMDGRLINSTVYQHPGGNSTMELNTGKVAPGNYMLNIQAGNNDCRSFNVLIQ